jgi:catalase
VDTQITRLGGLNCAQLPINRPHCPVNDTLRDGMHQTAIHTGVTPYQPNSVDGDEPQLADEKHGGYVQTPRMKGRRCARSLPRSTTTSRRRQCSTAA